jgi:thiol-disulfide isomerase/thioredoxin
MKKIILYILLQVPVFVFAQSNFNLKGEIKNLTSTKNIYLIRLVNQKEELDSAKVTNGKFEFNIALSSPSIAILLLDHNGNALKEKNGEKDIYRFFIEPGMATLTASEVIANAEVKGLNIFKDHADFLSITQQADLELGALNTEFSELPNEKRADAALVKGFQERYLAIIASKAQSVSSYIATHPNSYISLYALNTDLSTDNMDVDLVEKSYQNLTTELKQNSLAKIILAKLDLAKRTNIGVIAPEFEEKTAEQISIKLSSLRGQYVLVDFWASWCGPCRQENPVVVAAYEAYKDKNFTVLGVSIDDREDLWTKAVKADGLVWTQLLDRNKSIAQLYGVNAIPKNFLVNPDGKIVAKNLRGPALMQTLNEFLDKKTMQINKN